MLTSGKFLVSFEVPGPLPGTTEGFCEEMNVVYRTEELNTYLRYPKQEINQWHKHSTYIRLKLREILEVNLTALNPNTIYPITNPNILHIKVPNHIPIIPTPHPKQRNIINKIIQSLTTLPISHNIIYTYLIYI